MSVEIAVAVLLVVVAVLIHVHRPVELGQLVGQQPYVGLEETQLQRDRLSDELSVFTLGPHAAHTAVIAAAAVFGGGPAIAQYCNNA